MRTENFKTLLLIIPIVIFTINCGGGKNPFLFEDDFSTVPAPYSVEGITPIEYENGLKIYVLKEGTGQFTVNNRDEVLMYYTGRKLNGDIFDSSFKNGRTQPTQLSVTSVIEGFRLGMLDMKEGGKKVLVIPPSLAYGNSGNELRNDTLIFDIELDTILN